MDILKSHRGRNASRSHFHLVAMLGLGLMLGACSGGDGGDTGSAPGGNPSDTLPPSVPLSVSATAVSSSAISITWPASTDNIGVTGYRVYRNGGSVGTTASTSFVDTGLSPSTSYRYAVAAYDGAGNQSVPSVEAIAQTLALPSGNTYYGNPTNYLMLLNDLRAGDTLILEPGNYDPPNAAPGLAFFGMHGVPAAPITVRGADPNNRPIFLGRSTHNTVRLDDASYIVIKDIEIDGRDLGGDGINSQGISHHITLDGLYIHGVGGDQQVVGISTNGGTTWNWTIRNTTIDGAGTGMYLGGLGNNPFVAGLIEYNVIKNTIGYNAEIKHQNSRPNLAGMPTGQSRTVIRHNVFSKGANSATGGNARPNFLVGHFPPDGTGSSDVYEIYGNFFYNNPSEVLFQGEGNVAFYNNLLVNNSGSAIDIQPHNDVPKMIRIFNNTVVATGTGIRITGGATGYTQKVIANAVFASTPINAADQQANIGNSYGNAGSYLTAPFAALGVLDLYPLLEVLKGSVVPTADISGFTDWDKDFNGIAHTGVFRGAYSGEGVNPGWLPRLVVKPNPAVGQ